MFFTISNVKKLGLRFADLVHRLSTEYPEMRFRCTSPHPKDFPDKLLNIMRGFCGETEEEHGDTLSLVNAVSCDMANMFAYSMREKLMLTGTVSVRNEDDVPNDV
ncbi:hypothetical protein AgCh_029268 [Apium graveolens]